MTTNRRRILAIAAWALAAAALPASAPAQRAAQPLSGHAWSETAGWIDFAAAHAGATVTATHLAGFAWGPDVGWIKLGVDAGGPYANSGPTDWGVNRGAGGTLSGYAWSETLGWVDFAAEHAQLGMAADGRFAGYAWSDSLGWIRFGGASYGVAGEPGGVVTEVPTLGEWGLILMAVLLAALGVTRVGRVC